MEVIIPSTFVETHTLGLTQNRHLFMPVVRENVCVHVLHFSAIDLVSVGHVNDLVYSFL